MVCFDANVIVVFKRTDFFFSDYFYVVSLCSERQMPLQNPWNMLALSEQSPIGVRPLW